MFFITYILFSLCYHLLPLLLPWELFFYPLRTISWGGPCPAPTSLFWFHCGISGDTAGTSKWPSFCIIYQLFLPIQCHFEVLLSSQPAAGLKQDRTGKIRVNKLENSVQCEQLRSNVTALLCTCSIASRKSRNILYLYIYVQCVHISNSFRGHLVLNHRMFEH